jgi:hypothetical protein
MDFFRIKLLLLCLLCIAVSCTENDNDIDELKETITLEDGLNINYDDLTALAFDEEADVDENGGFDIDISANQDLPIIFLKNDEIIFGYYSKTGNNNTVSVDDILLFYFSMHPEVVKQGILEELLLQKIKLNKNYNKLKELIRHSLRNNKSPFKDSDFVKLLNECGYEVGIQTRKNKGSKNSKNTEKYNFIFTRDGKIEWEKHFPVYCTVGLEIVDKKTNESVSGTQVLDKSGLVLSPGSGIKWLYDFFITEESDTKVRYELPKDGEYQINLSNGVDNFGTIEFESTIDEINRINLGIEIVNFMIPIGIEKVLGKADCRDAIVGFFKGVSLSGLKTVFYLNGNLNKVEAEKELFNISNDIYDEIVKCALGGKGIKFIDRIKDISDKYFNKVEDGASIVLFIRDYVVSDIKSSETRYFYDGVSFGKLSQQNLSGQEYINSNGDTEFKGATNSEYIYRTEIKEDVTNYNIKRLLWSSINVVTEKQAAIGIPFEIKKSNDGDAKLIEVDKIVETRVDGTRVGETVINGTLQVKFKMGTKDTQFEIKPSFKGKGLPDVEVVDLKPSGLRIGDLHEGGVVFYIDETGEHGLVCALKDQANKVKWGCDQVNINGADGIEIGTGLQNTLDIIAGCDEANIAAKQAYSGDWFLPSYHELVEMAKNQKTIEETALANGGESFLASFYYSSTEVSSESVYLIHFRYDHTWGAESGPHYGYHIEKGPKWREVYHVRAVKAF